MNWSVKVTELTKDIGSDIMLIDAIYNLCATDSRAGLHRSVTESKLKKLLDEWQRNNTSQYDTGEI